MESKKLQRPRWLDSFLGPKNSNSKWLQENLDEMNRNVRRMLKIIEDTNADSFAKKVEMYYQSRQELINLVGKCYRIHCSLAERYNHGTRELLNYIPSSDLIPSQISISNVRSGKSSAIQSPLPLSKFPSSKQLNVHESSGSKQLKRGVSVKGSNHHIKGKISKNPTIMSHSVFWKQSLVVAQSESEDSSNSNYSDTRSDNDDGEELQHDEGTDDELEAELRNMIEKLYIELEGDRVVSKLQGGILRYEDIMSEDDGEFRKVKESVSSKALLEENLELQCEINRRLYLEEYTNEINEHCESLEEALIQARAEKIEAETEVEQLKASIVKKNNDVEELNKILEAVEAERDQLKARVAMLAADPYKS